MFTRIVLPAALLLALAPAARAGEEIVLFDGKTLDGWVAEGVTTYKDGKDTKPVWTVKDGQIECAGKGFGFLRYDRKEFTDFTFHVEYSMAKPDAKGKVCNSGIGVRTTVFDPKKSAATRPSYYSYEIQLLDDAGKPANNHGTGSLYRYVAPKVNAVKPAPEWNVMEVTCVGPRIRIVLNGQELIDVDQTTIPALKNKPLKGYVCVQNHGGQIAFRNLRVRDLTPSLK